MGIDPALARTGWALLYGADRPSVCAWGLIETPDSKSEPERLWMISQAFSALLDEHRPEAVVIELPFGHHNLATYRLLSEVRGVLLVACAAQSIPVFTYAPTQIKRAIAGRAHASKAEVEQALLNMASSGLLDLGEVIHQNRGRSDLFDAVACALTHLRQVGSRVDGAKSRA